MGGTMWTTPGTVAGSESEPLWLTSVQGLPPAALAEPASERVEPPAEHPPGSSSSSSGSSSGVPRAMSASRTRCDRTAACPGRNAGAMVQRFARSWLRAQRYVATRCGGIVSEYRLYYYYFGILQGRSVILGPPLHVWTSHAKLVGALHKVSHIDVSVCSP